MVTDFCFCFKFTHNPKEFIACRHIIEGIEWTLLTDKVVPLLDWRFHWKNNQVTTSILTCFDAYTMVWNHRKQWKPFFSFFSAPDAKVSRNLMNPLLPRREIGGYVLLETCFTSRKAFLFKKEVSKRWGVAICMCRDGSDGERRQDGEREICS